MKVNDGPYPRRVQDESQRRPRGGDGETEQIAAEVGETEIMGR